MKNSKSKYLIFNSKLYNKKQVTEIPKVTGKCKIHNWQINCPFCCLGLFSVPEKYNPMLRENKNRFKKYCRNNIKKHDRNLVINYYLLKRKMRSRRRNDQFLN